MDEQDQKSLSDVTMDCKTEVADYEEDSITLDLQSAQHNGPISHNKRVFAASGLLLWASAAYTLLLWVG